MPTKKKNNERRHRLRLTGREGWIEGTWTADTREEAEALAEAWAAKWMRGYVPGQLVIEDGQT